MVLFEGGELKDSGLSLNFLNECGAKLRGGDIAAKSKAQLSS